MALHYFLIFCCGWQSWDFYGDKVSSEVPVFGSDTKLEVMQNDPSEQRMTCIKIVEKLIFMVNCVQCFSYFRLSKSLLFSFGWQSIISTNCTAFTRTCEDEVTLWTSAFYPSWTWLNLFRIHDQEIVYHSRAIYQMPPNRCKRIWLK